MTVYGIREDEWERDIYSVATNVDAAMRYLRTSFPTFIIDEPEPVSGGEFEVARIHGSTKERGWLLIPFEVQE